MRRQEGLAERVVRVTMVAVSWLSAAVLAAGLAWWVARPGAERSIQMLETGILLLMTVPMFRVLQSAARGVRLRDWLHVGTIAAVAALLTLTIWYALHQT